MGAAFGYLGGGIDPAFEAVSVSGFQAAVRTGALVDGMGELYWPHLTDAVFAL
jgi:hypothetical protein